MGILKRSRCSFHREFHQSAGIECSDLWRRHRSAFRVAEGTPTSGLAFVILILIIVEQRTAKRNLCPQLLPVYSCVVTASVWTFVSLLLGHTKQFEATYAYKLAASLVVNEVSIGLHTVPSLISVDIDDDIDIGEAAWALLLGEGRCKHRDIQ